MNIYVIVVHHGTQDRTRVAVDSLFDGTRAPDGVVLVNNTAVDFPDSRAEVVVVQPRGNYGYGGGINVGLGRLYAAHKPHGDDLIVAMNNDICVGNDSLHNLEEWIAQNPEPALIGVHTKEPNGTVAGGGIVNKFTGRADLQYLFPTSHSSLTPKRLDYIHGAFVAAPWTVWRTVRGVPEEQFLYWEDVALSNRAQRAGFPLRVADRVTVEHSTAATHEMSSDQLYYLVRNGAHFMASHSAGLARHFWRPYNYARLGWHTLRGGDSVVREALGDAIKGKKGKR